MMILIVGRTSSGKDYFAERLTEKGLKMVKSYSTRPKRTPDEDTHIFVTPEEAAQITDKAATTVINGYEYFGTAQQVKDNDIYIIDPNGLYELTGNMPDENFLVVYVSADPVVRRQRAIARAMPSDLSEFDEEGKKQLEDEIAATFDSRSADEDGQFSAFEEQVKIFTESENPWEDSDIPKNVTAILDYRNDFTMQTLADYANTVLRFMNRYNHILDLVNEASDMSLIDIENDGIKVYAQGTDTDDSLPTLVSKDTFISYLSSSPSALGRFMKDLWDRKAVLEGKLLQS